MLERHLANILINNCVPIDPTSDKAKKKLSGIWEVIGEREDTKKNSHNSLINNQ